MPINATCTNCGKSYQAPDTLAGKSVRCKGCGTVFRIEQELDRPEPGDLDFDALERSFAGEAVDTQAGKPAIDTKGKVSIPRSGDVADVALAGGGGAGMRSNFRYRFPMAKQVDQFLPWVLLVGGLLLLFQFCASSREAGQTEAPTTGVVASRFALLVAAYVVILFPAAHLAMHKASRKLRFSMPRAAAWRTFTGFIPLLVLGAGLYMISGGSVFMLVLGVVLGVALSVGAITLLYRLFPNEMPTVGAYAGGGALLGSAFTCAVLFAINLVSLSIANMSKKEPELFVSPIALGLAWQEKPAPKLAVVTPKPQATPPVETQPAVSTPSTTQEAAPPVAPMVNIEPTDGTRIGDRPLVKKIEKPPVAPAFDLLIAPPIEANMLAVVRDDGGGLIESYHSGTWLRSATGRNFQRIDPAIALNTLGDIAIRMLRTPNYRIEGIDLSDKRRPQPIVFDTDHERKLIGFVNDRNLLVFAYTPEGPVIERYDMSRGIRIGSAMKIGNTDDRPLEIGNPDFSVRLTPDGKHLLVAGRAHGTPGEPGRLVLFKTADVKTPLAARDLRLAPRFYFLPMGLAINNSTHVAMLLNTDNEAYFTLWQMLDETIDGVTYTASPRPLFERKLGIVTQMRPEYWEDNRYDALVWINENALLLWGTYIVDAQTGSVIGETGLKGICGQIRTGDNTVALVQRATGTFREVVRVTFDPDVIKLARTR